MVLFPVDIRVMPIVDLWREAGDCQAFHNSVATIVTRGLLAEDW
jgi:hypothetical protein